MPSTVAIEQLGTRPLPPNTAVCIGAFDGLHLGHQALLARARTLAPHTALVTFEPHPMRVLAPERAPRLLQTQLQRLRVAGHLGVERVVLLPFDSSTALTAPEAFAENVFVQGLNPAAVVVGGDFRFGHRRAGTPQRLAALLGDTPVSVVDAVPPPDPSPTPAAAPEPMRKLGSTDVRRAVAEGAVERARAMLGRHYAIAGRVVHGDARGRTLGFRTANVEVDNELLPPPGVYATILSVWSPDAPDFGAVWASVSNLGTRPTFTDSDAPLRLECHVLDHDLGERLYDAQVEVAFVAKLRPEQRFESAAALTAQIQQDATRGRAHIDAAAIAAIVPPGLPHPTPS